MKHQLLLFLFVFIVSSPLIHAQAKPPLKISSAKAYYEQSPTGLALFADNEGYSPYTISVKLDLENMQSDNGNFFQVVVPGQTRKMQIGELTIKNQSKKSSFSMGSTYLLGNAIDPPAHTGIYTLPFKSGERYLMSQGYNGNFSHKDKNALDFTMEEGTEVCAARNGVVIEVIDQYDKGCNNPSCIYEANTITVYHEDGTFADYAHLKKRGSKVKVGDEIMAGQVIGYSGNTGYSSGPHLHFEVYYFKGESKISIPTKFDIGNQKTVYLQEKVYYEAQ